MKVPRRFSGFQGHHLIGACEPLKGSGGCVVNGPHVDWATHTSLIPLLLLLLVAVSGLNFISHKMISTVCFSSKTFFFKVSCEIFKHRGKLKGFAVNTYITTI